MYKTPYTVRGQQVERLVVIDDVESKECPVSLGVRDPATSELVSQVIDSMVMRTTTGAVDYGMDPNKWPTFWYDAVIQAAIEDGRIQEARSQFRAE